jgi:hypothetical protein
MNRAIVVCVVLIGLLLNLPSLAEEFKAAPYFVRYQSKLGLLGRETVQKELGLTKEQIEAVSKIMRPSGPLRMAELDKQLTEYSEKGLTAAQLARFEEIYLQAHGADALFNGTIATKLGLSDDQKKELNDLRRPYMAAAAAWIESRREIPREDHEKRKASQVRRQEMMVAFDDTATRILTAKQLDQLKKMRGKPIDLSGENELGGLGPRRN